VIENDCHETDLVELGKKRQNVGNIH